jgi:IS4 transposase
MRVVDDHVGAVDLSQVVLTKHDNSIKYHGILTNSDLEYQEARKKRRVRKINFEER